MTYPQPSSNQYLINGQDYFRLTTALVSPGDIYESEVSCKGFALGPNSDLANVLVNYLDEQATPSLVNQFTLNNRRGFTGRIDARMDINYPQLARTGRVLFSSIDIFDPTARPPDFDGATDKIDVIAPVMDVFQYFQSLPSVLPERADKKYDYKYYDVTGAGAQWITIPTYGRNSTMIDFKNWDAIAPASVTLFAVNYTVEKDPKKHLWTLIKGTTVVAAAGGTYQYIINASTADPITGLFYGRFDAICIGVEGTSGPCPMRITLTDDPL
jgi:hypothetical protein